jgi:tetratricopeptide (TPR) repeat protein
MKLSPLFSKFLPYLALIFFGFLLYYQTLFFSFTYLDDNKLILDNQAILNQVSLSQIFTSDVFFSGIENSFYYRPLLTISFLIDMKLGGTLPFFFHFTNLFLHLIAACLIFFIFKKYFFSKNTAFFLTAIFLVHPVMSQAVAWIPGRNDSLLAIFILAALALFLNFLQTDKIKYFWWHLAFFILALFTKETAIFLPLLLIAYYFLFDYKFTTDKKDNFLIILTSWFSVAFIWFLFKKIAILGSSSVIDLLLSGWHNALGLFVYLSKIIIPFNLSVYPTINHSTFWFSLITILIIIVAVYYSLKINYKNVIFGLLWFLVFLLPSFLSPNPEIVFSFFEHRLYLPFFGLLICAAELYPLKGLDWSNRRNILRAILVIIFFSLLTVWHTRDFSDRLTFWQAAVGSSSNSAFAKNNLGAMYHLEGDLDAAKHYYLEALKLDANQRLVHNNLGLIAVNQKNYVEAEQEYLQELAINPYYDIAWANLGSLYIKLGRLKEAVVAFQKAYQANPNNRQAYNNLLILNSKVE